jgi:hypothetical protein
VKRRAAAGVVIVAAAIVVFVLWPKGRDAPERDVATNTPKALHMHERGSAFDFADIASGAANRTRLEGEVIDDRDQPVGSATVPTTTEADGSFAFDDLPLGVPDLTAIGGDFATDDVSIRLTVDAEP